MSEIKWIKIVTDIFDDEKILLIEALPDHDSIIVIWFKLLCLAGKQNNGGVFIVSNRLPYSEEMFATIFRRPINTVRLALQTFEQLGMIEIVEGVVTIPNWDKHQSLDALESKRAYNREYMRERRAKQRELVESVTMVNNNIGCGTTVVTTSNDCSITDKSRLDKIREDKIREDKNKEPDPFDFFADEENNPMLGASLRDYALMRKEIKKPMTVRAKRLLINKLKTEFKPEEWIPVLEQSILNSWQGIFPLKEDKNGKLQRNDRQNPPVSGSKYGLKSEI